MLCVPAFWKRGTRISIYVLDGGELRGDKLVKFAYFDEAGVANVRDDPHVVIAGAIVDADKQWMKVATYLSEMADRHIRPEHRIDFVFHAKELHHGGKIIDREIYSPEQRKTMLTELCDIPRVFNLPVVAAYTNRSTLAAKCMEQKLTNGEVTERAHILSAVTCAMIIECYMRNHSNADEIATLVFENHDRTKRLIKEAHNFLKTKAAYEGAVAAGINAALLPFRRIPDAAFFAEKKDSSLLQVADVCAFAVKRHLAGQDKEGYFSAIADNIVMGRPIEAGSSPCVLGE